jgi:hypothetical protein
VAVSRAGEFLKRAARRPERWSTTEGARQERSMEGEASNEEATGMKCARVQRRYARKNKIKIRTSDAMPAKTTSETNTFPI